MKKQRQKIRIKMTAAILPVIVLLAAVFLTAAGAFAAGDHVTDTYGLFSDAEIAQLESACMRFEQQTGIRTAILSVDSYEVGGYNDRDSIRYIEKYADSLPDSDFIGLLINMDARYYYIDVRGDTALRVYTDNRQEQLGEDVVSGLASGNYAYAAQTFLDRAVQQYTYAVENNSYGTLREEESGFRPEILGGAGLLSALISAIATRIRAGKHNEKRPAADADRYIVPGTVNLYKNRNVFVSQYVTRMPVAQEKQGGGGGGFTTTHMSGGGSMHSGHGGHF